MAQATIDTTRQALTAQVEAEKRRMVPPGCTPIPQPDGTLAGYGDQWGEAYLFQDTYHISRSGDVRELDDVRAVCLGCVDADTVRYEHWHYKGCPTD